MLKVAVARVEGHVPTATAQLFCLFGAEWWRRHHSGGVWKWDPILAACGWSCSGTAPSGGIGGGSTSLVRKTVEEGLRRWQRPVLLSPRSRLFLVTLACEGGLPLQLLRRHGNSLRRFFRHLLREYQVFRYAGVKASKLAEGVAEDLPSSLRQDVVFEMSGQLIEEIWRLQDELGETSTPVRDLDSKDPGWRERLPLELEDETALALLNNLVEEASELWRRPSFRVALRRRLIRNGSLFHLEAELVLPGHIDGSRWSELLGVEESALPLRRDLVVETPGSSRRPVALVSEVGAREGRLFRVEKLVRCEARGEDAAGPYALYAGYGAEEAGPLDLPGGSELPGDLPWVFVPESSAPESGAPTFRLSGSGSVSTRHPVCWVAVGETWQADIEEGTMRLGELRALQRSVFEVSGDVTWREAGGETTCRVRTAQEVDDGYEYRLVGRRERYGEAAGEVFHGVPKIFAQPSSGEGAGHEVSRAVVVWRPRRANGADWRELDDECRGSVWLRSVEDGVLRFQLRAEILPATAEIHFQPGTDHRRGTVRLEGLDGAVPGLLKDPVGVAVHIVRTGDGYQVDLDADGEPPSTVGLRLSWDRERRMDVELPFPSRGARFLGRRGRVLRPDEQVTVDRLAGLRASAVSLDAEERFYVEGGLNAGDAEHHRGLMVYEELRPLGAGRFELDLGVLRTPLRRVLAASNDADAVVSLRVGSLREGLRPRRLRVGRYDLKLSPDRERGEVILAEDSPLPPDPELLRLQAFPLWDPENSDVEDLRAVDGVGRWTFDPQRREPGPWLILGWEGEWCRARPLLWTVRPGEVPEGELDELQQAIFQAAPERSEALRAVFDRLSGDPTAAEWERVFASLRWLADLPPSVLSVSVALARHPAAAVMALIVSAKDRDLVWDRLEELPFAWWRVPVRAWVRGAGTWRSRLLEMLGEAAVELADGELARFLDAVTSRARFFQPIAEWIRREVLGVEVGTGPVPASTEIVLYLLKQERQGLLQRNLERRWPQSETSVPESFRQAEQWEDFRQARRRVTAGVPGFRKSVLAAPVTAGLALVYELPLTSTEFYDLRRLREFDPAWFDTALELTVRLALEARIEEDLDALR